MKNALVSMFTVVFAVFATMASCSSCKTNTEDPAKNAQNAGINAAGTAALNSAAKILGKAAVAALLSVAQAEASGGNADYLSSAAQGIWRQASVATASEVFGDVTRAYSDGKLKQTAKEVERAAQGGLNSGNRPQDVSDAIATVLSTAAGAPPK